MPDELLAPIFLEQLNTKFRVELETANRLELELIKVEEAMTPPDYEQFSLTFRGTLEMPLNQGTYRMEHDKMETSDMFLVPIARDQEGFYYQACFNRYLQ
jgi:hypothetical protein